MCGSFMRVWRSAVGRYFEQGTQGKLFQKQKLKLASAMAREAESSIEPIFERHPPIPPELFQSLLRLKAWPEKDARPRSEWHPWSLSIESIWRTGRPGPKLKDMRRPFEIRSAWSCS